MSRDLIWSDDKPTVEGDYWWREHAWQVDPEDWIIVKVAKDDDFFNGGLAIDGGDYWDALYSGQYAGPIPMPRNKENE